MLLLVVLSCGLIFFALALLCEKQKVSKASVSVMHTHVRDVYPLPYASAQQQQQRD